MEQLYKYVIDGDLLKSHISMIEELKKYYGEDVFFNNLIAKADKQISKIYENEKANSKFSEDIEVFIDFVVSRILLRNFNIPLKLKNLDRQRDKRKIDFDRILKDSIFNSYNYVIAKQISDFKADLFIKNKIFMLCKNGERFHFKQLKRIEKIAYELIETDVIIQFNKTVRYATSKQ